MEGGLPESTLAATTYLRDLRALQAMVGHIPNHELAVKAGVAPNTLTAMRSRRPVTARKAQAVWGALVQLAQEMGKTLPEKSAPQDAIWRLRTTGGLDRLIGGRLAILDGKSPYVSKVNLQQVASGAYMTKWFRDLICDLLKKFGASEDELNEAFVQELDARRITKLVDESILLRDGTVVTP